jgi:hypothetical protein
MFIVWGILDNKIKTARPFYSISKYTSHIETYYRYISNL